MHVWLKEISGRDGNEVASCASKMFLTSEPAKEASLNVEWHLVWLEQKQNDYDTPYVIHYQRYIWHS